MCAIAGIIGENISRDLKKMLITLKHRGPDGSGFYVDGSMYHGEINQIALPEGSVGLGHNLLSIVGCESSQPIKDNNQVLVCNGEIYNFREIKQNLNDKFSTDSDCEVILKLINSFNDDNLVSSVTKTMRKLDGDYAFALWDGKNLVLGRDPVGVKPLYYGEIKDKIMAFASERKALWNIGIKEVHTLPPGHIKLNDQISSVDELSFNRQDSLSREPDSAKSDEKLVDDVELLKKDLENALVKSVEKRVKGLNKVGLIFSGGVDSTILAYILKQLPVKTTLYTVGTENSQDLEYALKAAEALNFKIRTLKVTEELVKNSLKPVIDAIEEFNIMKIGVGMPTYLAAKMAKEDEQKVVFTGQGADELFGGYNRYLGDFSKGEDVQDVLKEDITNIYHVNLQRDDAVTMAHGVELRVPFLDREVIKAAFNIPIKYKIQNENDKIRKHILRQVASDLGVPDFIAQRPKKAAQYGSGIHKILIKKVLKDFDSEEYMKTLRGF